MTVAVKTHSKNDGSCENTHTKIDSGENTHYMTVATKTHTENGSHWLWLWRRTLRVTMVVETDTLRMTVAVQTHTKIDSDC